MNIVHLTPKWWVVGYKEEVGFYVVHMFHENPGPEKIKGFTEAGYRVHESRVSPVWGIDKDNIVTKTLRN